TAAAICDRHLSRLVAEDLAFVDEAIRIGVIDTLIGDAITISVIISAPPERRAPDGDVVIPNHDLGAGRCRAADGCSNESQSNNELGHNILLKPMIDATRVAFAVAK